MIHTAVSTVHVHILILAIIIYFFGSVWNNGHAVWPCATCNVWAELVDFLAFCYTVLPLLSGSLSPEATPSIRGQSLRTLFFLTLIFCPPRERPLSLSGHFLSTNRVGGLNKVWALHERRTVIGPKLAVAWMTYICMLTISIVCMPLHWKCQGHIVLPVCLYVWPCGLLITSWSLHVYYH